MIATGWNESWPKSGIEKTELLLWHRCRSRISELSVLSKELNLKMLAQRIPARTVRLRTYHSSPAYHYAGRST
jgi:hypothetical protein